MPCPDEPSPPATPAPEGLANDHRYQWMGEALEQARLAALHGDVPVGAIVVAATGEIGRGHNRREVDGDPTAHAEVLALRDLARTLGRWNLDGATMYVTQEPCAMCAGALVNARIKRLVFGCESPKAGAVRSLFRLADDPRLNHRIVVEASLRAADCSLLLSDFFRRLRTP